MAVRKTELSNSTWRVTSAMGGLPYDKKITSSQMQGAYARAKADPKLGQLGVDVLKLAYKDARAKVGGDPTISDVRQLVSKAVAGLTAERNKGRVNDGYVDKREAGLVKGELAAAIFKLFDEGPQKSRATPAKDLAVKAPITKVNQAIRNLLPLVDKGFKLYDPQHDDSGDGLAKAMRKAADNAGLSASGRAALLTALNGATSRGDGANGPSADSVKQLLTNAQSKLKAADGAEIVDFSKPSKAPTSKKDGVVTGLELDRTPAATGMTSRALLAYAATL